MLHSCVSDLRCSHGWTVALCGNVPPVLRATTYVPHHPSYILLRSLILKQSQARVTGSNQFQACFKSSEIQRPTRPYPGIQSRRSAGLWHLINMLDHNVALCLDCLTSPYPSETQTLVTTLRKLQWLAVGILAPEVVPFTA
jgi:hypothetical protein